MQRRHLKKQGVNQNYPLPLERQPISEATINKASQQHEAPTQILPKSISYDQLLEIQHSMPHLVDRQGKPLNTVLPKVYYIRGGPLLANTQEASVDEQVVFPSLTVTQNHAYNSTQDIPGLDGYQGSSNQQGEITIDDDHLFLTQSQRSMHHYDYPKLQEDLYAGETDSLGYQSINNMF